MVYLNKKMKNWSVNEEKGKVYDNAGNEYDMHEIRAIFYWRQMFYENVGTKSNILYLKNELKKRIENDTKKNNQILMIKQIYKQIQKSF